ncbi:TIGR01777 family oxidoreductase [Paenibacillus sp. J5C_2022]|uniref:TIGR01777 family oxidoreductase n=1 Tax=Paenibacillus sp. J5C2022 TaxID=2977129 RepID=UPI0021D301C7|nr:TIGR01777 family oxidoreductase [Paenibacillus sp. J5C2022]MCU6710905.1 TIGR01777 family oxidoreductase [Paenibacillus sp. J5C2022]
MKVAVTGGTGFIGKALTQVLLERGDEVFVITRKNSGDDSSTRDDSSTSGKPLHVVTWDSLQNNLGILEGLDAIVNLAGESINQRWNDSAKARILNSRIWAAEQVAQLVKSLEKKPHVVVNASGISAYGISQDEVFDESSPTAVTDFLSEVVKQWEHAADRIPAERLVKLRVGVVLADKGGAFPLMALPYRLFGGGPVGSGKQGLSWIHLHDIVRLILFCLDDDSIDGPVNASAPQPVSNDEFGRAIAKAMGRPHWFPVPAFLMRLLFGEMSTLLLDGQRAVPKKSQQCGFRFQYPAIDSAMEQLVGKRQRSQRND